MFDIGFLELLLLSTIGLLVLGPERLPHALRVAGAIIGKARRTLFDFKREIETELTTHEFKQRVEKETQKLRNSLDTLPKPLDATDKPTEEPVTSSDHLPSEDTHNHGTHRR